MHITDGNENPPETFYFISVITIRIQKPWTILLPEIQKPKLHG
jgi:hypothetical protein